MNNRIIILTSILIFGLLMFIAGFYYDREMFNDAQEEYSILCKENNLEFYEGKYIFVMPDYPHCYKIKDNILIKYTKTELNGKEFLIERR